jgi:predicted membrane-bound spermidine synthase
MLSQQPTRIWPLFLLSFVEGGSLMAVELLGAKLLSPTYGNSIYVWSAVLGTTLSGLMAGYFAGGRASRSKRLTKWLTTAVAGAGLWVTSLPFTAPWLLDQFASLDFRFGILSASFFILFLPIALFGMVSPMAIQVYTRQLSEVGRSAGRIYAISTIGGLIFNFAVGLWLLPFVGIQWTAIGTGMLLMGTALLFRIASPTPTSSRPATT